VSPQRIGAPFFYFFDLAGEMLFMHKHKPYQAGSISIEGLVNNDNQAIQSLNSFLVSLSTKEKIRCTASREEEGQIMSL
jgi:hypothetical protein